MHMADALLSPTVGAAMWAASAGAIACCSARLRRKRDDRLPPLMGVLGAFLFAAQMINFSIPGTGSSGHLAGGLLLAILLGPSAAFLAIASVLVVQAFFFADGGLLALGCNIFNLGAIPAFLIYPLFYRKLIGSAPCRRHAAVTLLAAVLAMQLGALAVVFETAASGVSSLPFSKFLLLMQPIHLAIGLVEGAVTLAVVSFVRKARPELLRVSPIAPAAAASSRVFVLGAFFGCAVLTAGGLSFFASRNPDGLEWSVARVAGTTGLPAPQHGIHAALSTLQQKVARFPDYRFVPAGHDAPRASAALPGESAQTGTGVSGIVGTLLTLLLVLLAMFLLKKGSRGAAAPGA